MLGTVAPAAWVRAWQRLSLALPKTGARAVQNMGRCMRSIVVRVSRYTSRAVNNTRRRLMVASVLVKMVAERLAAEHSVPRRQTARQLWQSYLHEHCVTNTLAGTRHRVSRRQYLRG